ncbi:hypothetical protein AAEU23_004721 [Escherichia coli]
MLFLTKRKKTSKGLSLIEASMVLALSAIVVSGALYYYNNASSNRKLQEDAKTIQMVLSTIRALYENQRQDVPIDYAAVAKAGNFKTNSSGAIIMETGETLNIIDGTNGFAGIAGHRFYAVDFETGDKNICAHLASMRYGTSHFATLVLQQGQAANATSFLQKPVADRYLSVEKASQDCSTNIDGGKIARVYMAFKG